MKKSYEELTKRIVKLLKNDPGQSIKDLAKKLDMNRTFLAGYLRALENQGYVKSKRIGPAKVYFANLSMKKLTEFKTSEETKEGIPPGKIRCFITGELRNDTPKERVRQEVARSLVEKYRYRKEDIEVDFPIMIGRRLKRVDIVIFLHGMSHTQEYAYILAETNSENIKPSHKKNGIDQLKSYLSACPRARYGLWVGSERITIKVVKKEGRKEFVNIPDLLEAGKIEPPKVDDLSLS